MDHQLQNIKKRNRCKSTFISHLTLQARLLLLLLSLLLLLLLVGYICHVFFKCSEMHLTSAFYRRNPAYFPEIVP